MSDVSFAKRVRETKVAVLVLEVEKIEKWECLSEAATLTRGSTERYRRASQVNSVLRLNVEPRPSDVSPTKKTVEHRPRVRFLFSTQTRTLKQNDKRLKSFLKQCVELQVLHE